MQFTNQGPGGLYHEKSVRFSSIVYCFFFDDPSIVYCGPLKLTNTKSKVNNRPKYLAINQVIRANLYSKLSHIYL
jgi:hypothetical protein